jgi:hypothetical protein
MHTHLTWAILNLRLADLIYFTQTTMQLRITISPKNTLAKGILIQIKDLHKFWCFTKLHSVH